MSIWRSIKMTSYYKQETYKDAIDRFEGIEQQVTLNAVTNGA